MHYILKATKDPNIDCYVEWSTIVDSPIRWGRAQDIGLAGSRKRRTDQTGTSCHGGEHGWHDPHNALMVRELGTKGQTYMLDREKLYNFIRFLSEDGMQEDRDHQQAALDKYCRELHDE